jgi:tRNA(Ile)-lysidine synthase
VPLNFSKQVLLSIRKRELLRAGQRVGVAVSGGADSVALLRLLLELRAEIGIVLSVVHFNHKLRGRASDKDEGFVTRLAEKFGLTLHVGHADVARKAKQEKRNLEDAARRARYEYFRRLTESGQVDWVTTAHTADDQAETVLAHILRGTGLAGLAGIHPVTKDGIIRPLLETRRGDLRRYLRAKKQLWREDTTNTDTSRQRARMRKKLLPLLEKEFNPRVVEHLSGLAELARTDNASLELHAEIRCAALSKVTNGVRRHPARDLADTSSSAIASRMIRRLLEEARTNSGELSIHHVEAVRQLARCGENGKVLQLPGGVDVRRDNDWLVFLRREAVNGKKKAPVDFSYAVSLRGAQDVNVAVKEISCVIRFRSIDWPDAQRETIKKGWAALDRDKLHGALTLRSLRPGDRMRPVGHRGEHKLKRLLNEKRISRWEREGWPVLEDGKNIVWARGFVAAGIVATRETRNAIVLIEEKA